MKTTRVKHAIEKEISGVSRNDLDGLLHNIVAAAAKITASDSAGILLFMKYWDSSHLVVATNDQNELLKFPSEVIKNLELVLLSGQPINLTAVEGHSENLDNSIPGSVQDVFNGEGGAQGDVIEFVRPGLLVASKAHPMLAVVLMLEGRRIGILEIENKVGGRQFGDQDGNVLSILAGQAAAAIQNMRMIQGLQQQNWHLDELVREKKREIEQGQRILAKQAERDLLGLDMHARLEQLMDLIKAQAQAVQTLLESGQIGAIAANLLRVEQFSNEAQTEIRRFISDSDSSPAGKTSLVASLEDYISEYSAGTGIQTVLSLPENNFLPAFNPDVERNILHVINEALINVRKHAEAHKAEVLFSLDESSLQLIISDDGIGFDLRQILSENSFNSGLSKMRWRTENMGGRLEIRSTRGRGTKIIAYIPSIIHRQPPALDTSTKSIQGMRILLVDDSAIFIEGLSNLLSSRGLMVIGVARDGLEAQELTRKLRPDIIVMDVMMPRCNGLEATRVIHAEFPEIKILMLTASEKDEHVYAAIKNGASGFLLKGMDANEFCSQLASVARGEMLISAEMAVRMVMEFSPVGNNGESAIQTVDKELTGHQSRILDLVAGGMTYKEVGATLHLSEKTIKYHMAQILERLHLKNRTQAIAFARRFTHDPGDPV